MYYVHRHAIYLLILLCALIIIVDKNFDMRSQSGSIFFVDSTTVKKIRAEFETAKKGGERIKVLIVPGHDKEAGGAVFKKVSELGLNLELGGKLEELFLTDTRFDVTLAQDSKGYNPMLQTYFTEKNDQILEFRRQKHLGMYSIQKTGLVQSNVQVQHNNAPGDTVTKLYGLNMWANENGIDLVIHIHFNDTARKNVRSAGENSGFALYIPDHQYSNAAVSKNIAQNVYVRLFDRFPQSDVPPEKDGILEDQQLIGLGASNSLDAPSLFIEYAYIYEPQFQSSVVRKLWLHEAALQTYLGIVDFFENRERGVGETAVLPYSWMQDLSMGIKNHPDVLALQIALNLEGLYPPQGSTKNDCPLTGIFFECTKRAVKAFQKKYHLEASGIAERLTRAQLHILYGK
ncbi:MAG: hypothetical protein G01um101448_68 [Parcubacteria group bacterium Gr01-1014_48]|nr:MAG: hypothetical protein Greene041614_150 [Parcubacteria group bacterium Greene0416_14]TSC74549.1 MAG: hypothetical protein G01um101448_68 [Parcubacteria group bacterium Gr01-1014_48]TSD01425.1 MAG: hypothetical protein Greene101415_272 [Parcubacteria group bacterium Greene1014_15]TSD08433.1 MAG: hypothetical protein Greene07144_63 [Parcubacteria group bacterium Greene0714_4]